MSRSREAEIFRQAVKEGTYTTERRYDINTQSPFMCVVIQIYSGRGLITKEESVNFKGKIDKFLLWLCCWYPEESKILGLGLERHFVSQGLHLSKSDNKKLRKRIYTNWHNRKRTIVREVARLRKLTEDRRSHNE